MDLFRSHLCWYDHVEVRDGFWRKAPLKGLKVWFTKDFLSLHWVSSTNLSYLCDILTAKHCETLTDRQGHYFFMCFGRPFLWRHTSRSDHFSWQSTVDWIQKQQQLGWQRLFSSVWRYSTDDMWVFNTHFTYQHPPCSRFSITFKNVDRTYNLTSRLLCSHLWGRGEAGQRPNPIAQLSWWLPVQQSVCVENHSSGRFRCWPLLPVIWGKFAFIVIG